MANNEITGQLKALYLAILVSNFDPITTKSNGVLLIYYIADIHSSATATDIIIVIILNSTQLVLVSIANPNPQPDQRRSTYLFSVADPV